MKVIAESYIGMEVTNAVITVPAYFNDAQRQATKNAGAIAGLNVLRIINEPTAAAMAYGFNKRSEGEKNVLIFDLGGGTFDVSILAIENGIFEVKSTSGDTHLGGEDFDNILVDYFVDEFHTKNGKNLRDSVTAIRKLRIECERAKIELSNSTQTTIVIEDLFDKINFKSKLSRATLEDLCLEMFEQTKVEKALADANLEKTEIDEIILIGGSTRIPKVQQMLQDFFDGKKLNFSINPDESVAYGAAIQAAILNGDDLEIEQDMVLLDVTPLSLGIQTSGGVMTKLIERNTQIPTSITKIFSTDKNNQTCVLVQVYEGERGLTKDNNLLGRFQLRNIPELLRCLPKIEVTFDIDVNGILNVTAVEKSSGNNEKITIQNDRQRLNQKQIEEMITKAEQYKQEDEMYRERIKCKSDIKNYVYHLKATENQEKFRANMSNDECEQIQNKSDETLKCLENDAEATIEELGRIRRELYAVCNPLLVKFKQTIKQQQTTSNYYDNNNNNVNSQNQNQNRGQNSGAGPSGIQQQQNKDNNNKGRKGPIITEVD